MVSSKSVPVPYTPVESSEELFCCLGRTTTLGAALLPEQIASADENLLSASVRVVAEASNALDGITGRAKVLENRTDAADWEWFGGSEGFSIEARMTGECDGFCWYEIKLVPKQPVRLSGLRLELPRSKNTARYIHSCAFGWGSQTSGGIKELGGSWQSEFLPYVWLGDEDRGLAWCAESDQGWDLEHPEKALEVRTEGDTVFFAVNLLDHDAVVDSPIQLRFGLQATPTKPVSLNWKSNVRILHNIKYDVCEPDENGKTQLDELKEAGVNTIVFHDEWTDYFGKLTTPYDKELRKLIDECHKRDMRLLVYVGYGVARTAPEIQGHHDEWSVLPLIPWDTKHKPEVRAFDATCAKSSWGDWLVDGVEKLFDDYELDGLYFDGTTFAFRCQNEIHGCGWRDSKGELHDTYPVLSVRKMIRGIADAVKSRRPEAILDVHMSTALTMPTLSFCDSYWDGEQYEIYNSEDNIEIPLDAFRAEFMGYAHGLNAEFLCYVNRPFTFDEAIAVAWLHGVEVRPYPETIHHVVPIWRVMDDFGTTKAAWLPYWKGSGVDSKDETVKASVFTREGKALLFVSHVKREPLSTTLRLDPVRLGLTPGDMRAKDALSNLPIDLNGNEIPIDFDGIDYRLIELTSVR